MRRVYRCWLTAWCGAGFQAPEPYTVQAGDTCTGITGFFGISTDTLQANNPVRPRSAIGWHACAVPLPILEAKQSNVLAGADKVSAPASASGLPGSLCVEQASTISLECSPLGCFLTSAWPRSHFCYC